MATAKPPARKTAVKPKAEEELRLPTIAELSAHLQQAEAAVADAKGVRRLVRIALAEALYEAERAKRKAKKASKKKPKPKK